MEGVGFFMERHRCAKNGIVRCNAAREKDGINLKFHKENGFLFRC